MKDSILILIGQQDQFERTGVDFPNETLLVEEIWYQIHGHEKNLTINVIPWTSPGFAERHVNLHYNFKND